MNQTQKKYTINRIANVVSEKKNEAKNKFTTPAVSLTDKQKYDLVASGKVKMFPYNDNGYYYNGFRFDFSKYESDSKFNKEAYEKAIAELDKLHTKANDMIMLGDDCDEAVKILSQLENFKI